MPEALQLSDEFNYALGRMEAGANMFLTGRAGTGKSTLLQIFKRSTRKNVVVLAPYRRGGVERGRTDHPHPSSISAPAACCSRRTSGQPPQPAAFS